MRCGRLNGLMRAEQKADCQVSLTGSPPVIKGACMLVYELEWAIYRQFGWYRRLMKLVPCVRGRLFLRFCPSSMELAVSSARSRTNGSKI